MANGNDKKPRHKGRLNLQQLAQRAIAKKPAARPVPTPEPEKRPPMTLAQALVSASATRNRPPVSPEAEQYITDLPGVGAGLLDTLRRLHDKPVEFDTATTHPGVYGQYFRNEFGPTARVTLNPAAMMYSEVLNNMMHPDSAPIVGDGFSDRWNRLLMAESHAPALTLAHEVLGHGAEGMRGSRAGEHQAEAIARSFVRQSGRANLPFRDAGEMMTEGTMRRLLARLQGR